jgi:hypothetical protein
LLPLQVSQLLAQLRPDPLSDDQAALALTRLLDSVDDMVRGKAFGVAARQDHQQAVCLCEAAFRTGSEVVLLWFLDHIDMF